MTQPSITSVRSDFPFLERRINGKPIIYFDNAATTQKPRKVINAIVDFYSNHCGNIHRGDHTLSEEASQLFEDARATVARFINAADHEVIFVRNTTEAINLVSAMLDRPGDVLLPISEHHSNLLPWRRDRHIRYIKLRPDGTLDRDDFQRQLESGVALVACSAVTNAFGVVNPIAEMVAAARQRNILTLVDASQSVAHHPTDVVELDCDFLTFSGHKVYGPSGIGVLFAREEFLRAWQPWLRGGGTVKAVSPEDEDWNDLPARFEAGTPNIEGAIGLAAGLDVVDDLGWDWIEEHERCLAQSLWSGLRQIPRLTLHGTPEGDGHPTVAFSVVGVDSHVIARLLNERDNIMVRAGFHCAHPLHQDRELAPTVRVSLGIYNTVEEVKRFLRIIEILSH